MKGLLKFITCGSVDDGKSTLIGHILYDAKLLYADQEKALELDSKVGSREGAIDYSLLLDGLMAEREQGITIDVAYRYFTTDNRSFIVADTPGHEEYTRNMAVGASFAELAIILIDATQGVLIQTRRHARICSLMGIRHYVFAVNKMDLANYDKARFEEIEKDIDELSKELSLNHTVVIPVSATEGDNITVKSETMDWYDGPVLLDYLETVDVDEKDEETGFYMPVQRVCRPNHTFRGFEGQVETGSVSVGDTVTALPSNEQANVKDILLGDKHLTQAIKGQSITIQLDREVDVSRGCVITDKADLKVAASFSADVLWMDDDTLEAGKNYFVKIGTRLIPGTVTGINYSVDINTGEHKSASKLSKNELASCNISLADGIVIDEFDRHRTAGELILIDRVTNMTSACGVVSKVISDKAGIIGRISRDTRAALNGQKAVIFEFPVSEGIKQDTVRSIEKILAMAGRHTYLYHPIKGDAVIEVLRHLHHSGIVVLFVKDENIPDINMDDLLPRNTYRTDWLKEAGEDAEEIADYIFKETSFAVESSYGEYI